PVRQLHAESHELEHERDESDRARCGREPGRHGRRPGGLVPHGGPEPPLQLCGFPVAGRGARRQRGLLRREQRLRRGPAVLQRSCRLRSVQREPDRPGGIARSAVPLVTVPALAAPTRKLEQRDLGEVIVVGGSVSVTISKRTFLSVAIAATLLGTWAGPSRIAVVQGAQRRKARSDAIRARTVPCFKAPKGFPNALAGSPEGLWIGEQKLSGELARQY